jgi:hypothetical protein
MTMSSQAARTPGDPSSDDSGGGPALAIGAFTSRGRVPAGLAVVQVIWEMIGGSAAVLLAVPMD